MPRVNLYLQELMPSILEWEYHHIFIRLIMALVSLHSFFFHPGREQHQQQVLYQDQQTRRRMLQK
jgi:hypothetical protein